MKRRLVVGGLDVEIETTGYGILVKRNGEIIGQLRNQARNRFSAIPSPQRGHNWEVYDKRDDAILSIIRRLAIYREKLKSREDAEEN